MAPDDGEFLFAVYVSTREHELAGLGWSREQAQGFFRMQFNAQQRHYSQVFPNAQWQIVLEDGLFLERKPD